MREEVSGSAGFILSEMSIPRDPANPIQPGQMSLAPLWGLIVSDAAPRACALGYNLAPLRGSPHI
jgi:hypothetical protein